MKQPPAKCDLCIPDRFRLAMVADGWIVRVRAVPWVKRSTMPESVTDRPTIATEDWIMLSKSGRYFWDAQAVRRENSIGAIERFGKNPKMAIENRKYEGMDGESRSASAVKMPDWLGNGRAFRSTDPYFDTLDSLIADTRRQLAHLERIRERGGLLLADDGLPLALDVTSQGSDLAHYACVDSETEALTRDGWMRQENLKDGDEIATYDAATERLTFAPATFNRYDYSGPMVKIEKREASQRLTPEHRCLVRHTVGSERKVCVRTVSAGMLNPKMEIPLSAPLDVCERESIGMGLAELLGWYVTEGHDDYPGHVSLYQSENANPSKVERIRELLQEEGAVFTEGRRVRGDSVEITFNVRGSVAARLQELAPGKVLPFAIVNLPRFELQMMFDAMIDGDGHRRADDGRIHFCQVNRQRTEVFEMIALRLGLHPRTKLLESGISHVHATTGHWLTLRSANGVHSSLPIEQYDGKVWCPTVGSGFWLARRNGKPFITGNSFPEGVVTPWILGGSPQEVCAKCGAGYVRVTESEKRPRGDRFGMKDAAACFDRGQQGTKYQEIVSVNTLGWRRTCHCPTDDRQPAVVLDCFLGSGTTAVAARRLGRRVVGIDASEFYCAMAAKRLEGVTPTLPTPSPRPLAPTQLALGEGR